MVGLGGLEPPTSRLSGVRSNHLSYRPNGYNSLISQSWPVKSNKSSYFFFPLKGGDPAADSSTATLLRLHPSYQPYLRHLPPPILRKEVSPATSGIVNSHGVTGGVYKARELIHRGMLIRDY
jgi:hypothetical protein